MRKKIIFLIFLILLIGGAFLFTDNPLKQNYQAKTLQEKLFYDSFKAKHVYYINIQNGEETVNLVRKGDDWFLANDDSKANPSLMNDLIETILTMQQLEVVTADSQKWSDYGVGVNQPIDVQIKELNNHEIAHFLIGLPGPKPETQYVRKNNLNEVYLVNQNLGDLFSRPAEEWQASE